MRIPVYLIPDSIPQGRDLLPLIDQAGRFPFQNERRRQLCQLAVLKITGRITNINLAFAVIRRSPGFTAPFGAFDADSSESAQIFFYPGVNDTGNILLFFHKLHHLSLSFDNIIY